ncbi:protein-serine/threonine phosphatase [Ranunculus cassubicifolius]
MVSQEHSHRSRHHYHQLGMPSTPSSDSQGNQNQKELRMDDTDRKRKRKTEMDRPTSAPSSSSSSAASITGGELESGFSVVPSTSSSSARKTPEIAPVSAMFGSISVSGRSREMEDCLCVKSDLCRPAVSGRKPLHYFAVFDGHGGSHVASLCKERMHGFLQEELMREPNGASSGIASMSFEGDEERWRRGIEKSFERMDEVALQTCVCGCVGSTCGCESAGLSSEIVGSTAVVALVTPERIMVANCGDSRAVLSRGGRAVPLSFDHKPDRPDELARIAAAGGRVIYLNGARVLGILAMSRALGDKYLKPVVISMPEITFTNRTSEDECLILASDGLWDVISNEMACDVARKCLFEGNTFTSSESTDAPPPPPPSQTTESDQSQSRCSIAAALLTRLALGRRSGDNISVIVIDLKKS